MSDKGRLKMGNSSWKSPDCCRCWTLFQVSPHEKYMQERVLVQSQPGTDLGSCMLGNATFLEAAAAVMMVIRLRVPQVVFSDPEMRSSPVAV